MATLSINVTNTIHAEFKNDNIVMLKNTSIILDPITLSYSELGELCNYEISIQNILGLTDYVLLHNGKNTRFSTDGTGSCELVLTVTDSNANQDTDTITITVI